MRPETIYVSNADSGDITVLSRQADGQLLVAAQPQPGGALMSMALSTQGDRLVVVRRSEPQALLTLAAGPEAGLTVLGEGTLPVSMAYVSLSPEGRHALTASYHFNRLCVSAVDAHGVVGAVIQTLPTGPKAHSVIFSPDGRFALAACLGADEVLTLAWHPDHATQPLQLAQTWRQRSGAGPRHLRFHPHLPVLYLLNELDANLDVLAFDTQTGALNPLQTVSALADGVQGEPWAADLQITPDGAYLVSSERRGSTLALWRVDPTTGHLTLCAHTPTEAVPRGIALCAGGDEVLAVGQTSHHLSRYRLDRAAGRLERLQRLPMGQNPNWITVRAG